MIHVTGSRVFGTPRPDSDVDVCVLVSEAEAKILGDNADEPRQLREGCGSFPIRYGNLNIIVCTDFKIYNLWLEGHKDLVNQAPVTKELACSTFKRLGVS